MNPSVRSLTAPPTRLPAAPALLLLPPALRALSLPPILNSMIAALRTSPLPHHLLLHFRDHPLDRALLHTHETALSTTTPVLLSGRSSLSTLHLPQPLFPASSTARRFVLPLNSAQTLQLLAPLLITLHVRRRSSSVQLPSSLTADRSRRPSSPATWPRG